MSRKNQKSGKEKEKEVGVLSAVLLADSFTEDFRPISYEMPRVLMPIAGVTMLDYTMEFLASNGVEQIFIVANAHSKAIQEHVEKNENTLYNVEVRVLCCRSDCVASAIREINAYDVLRRDFILLMGDVITNMTLLRQMWKTHLAKTKNDRSILMTLVLQEQSGVMENNRRQLMEDSISKNTNGNNEDGNQRSVNNTSSHIGITGEDRVSAVIDPLTGNLLQYIPWKGEFQEDKDPEDKEHLPLILSLMDEHPTLSIRSDLVETGMAICSMGLLELFDQNFDYRDMRDCVKSVINDELLGNKIILDIIPETFYFRRVKTLESVPSITRSVLERWAYPLVVTELFASSYFNFKSSQYSSSGYIDKTSTISQSVTLSESYLIGPKTFIDDGCTIINSVLGEGVKLGKNCVITNSQIWAGVTIGNGSEINGSIICNRASVGDNCVVENNCIVSFDVKVSNSQNIQSGTRLSTKMENEESFDEVVTITNKDNDVSQVGENGYGKQYKHLTEAILDLHKLSYPEASDAISIDTLFTRSNSSAGQYGRETNEDRFARDVIGLLGRAVGEDLEFDGTCVELRSLKFSYDVTTVDTCRAILLGLLNSIEDQVKQDSSLSLLKTFKKVITSWGKILVEFDSNSVQDSVLETLIDFATDAPAFAEKISSYIYTMYVGDLISDDTILRLQEDWTTNKDDLEESETKMFEACQELFTALNEESEEEEEEEESEESD